jgi:hypothetical protein
MHLSFCAGLLAGVTIAAFSATSVLAAPTHFNFSHTDVVHRVSHSAGNRSLSVLYDQTSNDSGGGTFSQNTIDPTASQAADDFTVPDGTHWVIQEVDALGPYNGHLSGVQVTIYAGKHHKPHRTVYNAVIQPSGSGEFVLDLGNGVKLKPGHYWLSVVVIADSGDGQWFWENQTLGTTEGDPAIWQNPQDGWGTGCTSWKVESKCTSTPAGDHMFVLRGYAK